MKPPRGLRSGQILVLASMSMIALIGFAALAVDIGYMYSTRRTMQTAADAAAIAAANALQGTNSGSYQTAATDVATLNGFTNGQNGVTVTVGTPTSGPYSGNANYVEVDVNQAVPTFFLRVIGYNTLNVSARAVSGTVNGQGCIYALDPSQSGTIALTGNFTVNASCGIIDNSNSSSALTATGNGTIAATYTGVAGNYTKSGNVTMTPTPHINIAPSSDPLAYVPAPTFSSNFNQLSNTYTGQYSVGGNNQVVTVPPQIYSQGVSITGNSAVVTFSAGNYGNGISISGNVSSATFNPGTYQNGGSGNSISISGNATTTFNASGTYTFGGTVSITGNNKVTLSPGTYYGGISITGNANVTFNPGTYILAGGGLSVTGNSTLTGTGVTFYDSQATGYSFAPINMTGNETANLSAPTSGTLAAMLFFQDRSVSSGSGNSIVGNASSTFDGAIYFPTTSVRYVGNSSGSGYTFLIADTITVTGNSSMQVGDNYSTLANGSPVKSSTLYE
jgi:Putative Flp pilus-assembly TadE/G-like